MGRLAQWRIHWLQKPTQQTQLITATSRCRNGIDKRHTGGYIIIMKSFDDLEFTYDDSIRRWSASLTLDNGYQFSVISGIDDGAFQPFYGRYPDTFEVAVFNLDGNFVPLSVSDDVLGWQAPHRVTSLMHQFEMDGKAHEDLLVAMRADFNEKLVAHHN